MPNDRKVVTSPMTAANMNTTGGLSFFEMKHSQTAHKRNEGRHTDQGIYIDAYRQISDLDIRQQVTTVKHSPREMQSSVYKISGISTTMRTKISDHDDLKEKSYETQTGMKGTITESSFLI